MLTQHTARLLMPHKSIGFTAELGSNDDTVTSDFMPFFTPNRRPLHNMLEHVEPAGEAPVPQSPRYHRMAPFLNLG
jgi:hypothetical protein